MARSTNLSIPSSYTLTNVTAGVSGPPTNIVGVGHRYSESASGTVRHKPTGWLSPTSYNLVISNRQAFPGEVSAIDVLGTGWRYTGMVVGVTNGYYTVDEICNLSNIDVSQDIASLTNMALLKARSNLKDMSVDLGTAFGERNQTAHLIGDTAARMAKAVRSLRRGKVRDAMRALGVLHKKAAPRGSNWTNNWLELQYGWKPLLSDIYGACDALSKRGRDDWMVTAKGSASSTGVGSGRITSDGAPQAMSSSRYSLGAFCRIDGCPSEGVLRPLSSVGVTNPLNVAWELVPFSFVVDWFIPIGGWLESLDATLGFTIRGSSMTTYLSREWHGNGIDHTAANGTKYRSSFQVTKRELFVTRTTSPSVPLPSFPGLKDPRSLGHMANGLALLSQAFGRS